MLSDEEQRLSELRSLFEAAFGNASAFPEGGLAHGPLVLASAPGRTELAGNHVDHQGGLVISAAIGERTWGLAAENGTNRIRVAMEGFGADEIDLEEPDWAEPRAAERENSVALVRGMAAAFAAAGGAVRGFDMATASDVPSGCGLSSSAAFEVMVGAALAGLFGEKPQMVGAAAADGATCDAAPGIADTSVFNSADRGAAKADGGVPLNPVALALDAVAAEQRFFGKPCGAQDQLASACGGVVAMDFALATPTVERIAFDAAGAGFAAVLIDSRQDHSAHNDEFAAIPADMFAVAHLMGAERLGEVPVERLMEALPRVRAELGDLRAMRALHYYDETARVARQRDALRAGDFARFLANVRLSGASSAQFLQNVSVSGAEAAASQPAMVIQALCSHLLGERGAWRIHGGGFGGCVVAWVPLGEVDAFVEAMDGLLGYDACRQVAVGAPGARVRRLS